MYPWCVVNIVRRYPSALAGFKCLLFLVLSCRPIGAMPVVMTNSLGQVTLNSPSILTTSGVPVTVANTTAPPKLVIQALPSLLPAGSKAGDKITIITIPANQLATLMQANPSGQVTQLFQAKPVSTQLAQAGTKSCTPTRTVQLTAGRPTAQVILAKPAAVVQPLPKLSVSQHHPTLPKTSIQPTTLPNCQPEATQSDLTAGAAAQLQPNPPSASAGPLTS